MFEIFGDILFEYNFLFHTFRIYSYLVNYIYGLIWLNEIQ